MADPVTRPDPAYIVRVEAERRHLEGLFKDRINFHLLFASLFMVGLGKINDLQVRFWALLTITVVSFLMAVALVRTFNLVRLALKDIKSDDTSPYFKYQKETWWVPNANIILITIPWVLSFFFLLMTVFYGSKWHHDPNGTQDQSSSCTTFQVEDRSDRHVTSETEPSKQPAVVGTRSAEKNVKH